SHLIYHGSEPSVSPRPSKKGARKIFSLPEDVNIALASGFMIATKGWDSIRRIKVPKGWKFVVNGSVNTYRVEKNFTKFENPDIFELRRGFLNDKELSLLLYSADTLLLPYR